MTIAVFLPALKTPTGTAYESVLLGTLIPHPANAALKAVKLADGLYFCVTPDGAFRHNPEDKDAGPWQAFQLSTTGSFLIAGRGTGKTFLVPYVAYDGPATP